MFSQGGGANDAATASTQIKHKLGLDTGILKPQHGGDSGDAQDNYGVLYNIAGWGDAYFDVNAAGNLSVKIPGFDNAPERAVDVLAAINAAAATKKVQFPLILRFPGVLRHRIDSLHAAFDAAIAQTGYSSKYQGVFPVKVNQNRAVVEDIVAFGKKHNYGLEAGSKPELLLAMHCLIKGGSPNAFLVCNGYKDRDYVDLAFTARAMKLKVFIVLELEEELDLVIEAAKEHKGVAPHIGIRARLLTTISGHFGSTSGKHGKFGMLEDKIYAVAEKLRGHGMLDQLKMLHFHIGSMIPTTDKVGEAVSEAAGIYCNLVRMGAAMGMLDCGGGLGVDYDGTHSDSDMSVAYGLEEYALAVVQAAQKACEENGVPHPVLCTESGRAMVSHHSMIILQALSAVPEPPDDDTPDRIMDKIAKLAGEPAKILGKLRSAFGDKSDGSWHPCSGDLRKHGIELYKLGKKLSNRGVADEADIFDYHMNLSVFSMIPDFWGIKQLFPVVPAHRLKERPTQKGKLMDITCDSDGKVDSFIGGSETLPMHDLQVGSPYYIAVALTGAYQEALSGRHNLFGAPSVVRVVVDGEVAEGSFKIETAKLGPTSGELLDTAGYKHEVMYEEMSEYAEKNGIEAKPVLTDVFGTMPYLIVPKAAAQ